jgi:HK97 family phage portal protein
MTIAQTFRNLFSAPSAPPAAMGNKAAVGMASFDGVLSQMTRYGQFRHMETVDTEAAYKLAVTSAWVYSDIKLIADRVARRDAALCVHTRADGKKIKDHPFYRLMGKPNPFMSGSFLKRYLTWWYLLRGNAYLFVVTRRPGVGELEDLYPLAANMVRPLPETLRRGQGIFRNLELIDYEYNVNGSLEVLPGENVVHFRMPNPFDWWEGMSPLTAALLGVQMDHAQAVWQRDFFAEDNAIPSAIISVPSTTSPVDFDRQKEILRQQMKEGQKRLFTRSGDLTVETITQTLEQMQIIDSRKFNRDEIDRVYGVPEGLISGGLSGDSRLAAEIAFARNAVQPLIDYFAEQLSTDLALYYGDDIMFEAPNVIPQDRALEVQEYTIYSQDMSIDENREARGLEPAKLPPEVADLAKVPVRLLQYVKAASEPPPQPQAQQEPPQPADMMGSQAPANMVDEQAGKSIAVDAELKRWRKVAVKEFAAGRNPADRVFDSVVIDADHKASILAALSIAENESEVNGSRHFACNCRRMMTRRSPKREWAWNGALKKRCAGRLVT